MLYRCKYLLAGSNVKYIIMGNFMSVGIGYSHTHIFIEGSLYKVCSLFSRKNSIIDVEERAREKQNFSACEQKILAVQVHMDPNV
jgi:hypothetical protein